MTNLTRFNNDGSTLHEVYHPELAEASLACFKRDLKRLRQTKGKSFVRRPYDDLHEAQIIALNPKSPSASLIAGIGVFPVVVGETNARIPMTLEQVEEAISKARLVDCWTCKGFA